MSFLTKKVFNFAKPPFGLDLSDLSVKIIQLEKRGEKDRISAFGCFPIAPGNVVDGEVLNKELVISIIKDTLARTVPKKIKNKNVICSVPETKAFLRIVGVPKMSEEEIHEAIRWEMEANIPLPIDQVYYDWQVLDKKIGKDPEKINILVVAVAKKVIDQQLEIVEGAGLSVAGLEIESIAQARSFLREADEKTTVVMDIGDRRTSFSISVGNIPSFTCSVPISAQSLTDAISKGLGVSFEEAEKMKFNSGIGSIVQNDPIFKAVKPILENLAGELEKSMDFYLAGLGYSNAINRIIICGGGANTKGLIPFLSQRLGKLVELGDPWVNIKSEGKLPSIERERSVQFSTAIGLALKGLIIN